MSLNFPDNPQLNDTFTVNGRTYSYNGNKWRRTKPRLSAVSPTLDVANDFTAGGALHVDSSTGRVGIGTANPAVELHVDGNVEFTGTLDVSGLITSATAIAATNDTTVATTAYVQTALASLVDSAPATLDTLNELAAALGDDANFATTVTNSLAGKLDLTGGTVTGLLTASGGIDGLTLANGISGSNFNITGVNQIEIADPGEGIIWKSGASGDISLIVVDDASDNILRTSAAQFQVGTNTVWHAGNDGSGSGLDADLLDGNHASAFATSGHTHSYLPLSGGTLTGQLTMGTSASIRQSSTTWTGNPGSGVGKLEYHSNRWYIVAGSNSSEIVRFRRDGTDVAWMDNSGGISAGNISGGNISGAAGTFSNRIVQYNGTTSTIVPGSDNNGAIYLGGATTGTGATGAIEASWNNSLRPQIGIGVTRDGNNTKALFTYHGWGALYANNTTRFYWDTGGYQLYGTNYGASTIKLKENIRDGHTVDGMVSEDRDVAFDKWNSLRTVAFDWKEKFTDPIWRGCTEHENLFTCQDADCPSAEMERVEHICGQGWCYGTEEDPCPRYRKVRNVLGWIAEEVREVYGDHMVGYSEDRELESINMTSFNAEHVNVTQHLIKYIRELEERILALEGLE